MIKLGSLFDGIGVFPLCAEEEGIIPAWASEIEPFPIQVTKRHFPNMKHLGDITKINGAEIEPVDIITFGSPCQDVSMAGKRKGINFTGKYISRKSVRLIKKKPHEFDGFRRYLINTRSGLFLEAVRIIREMRSATDGRYPRFAIWENVPGVLSSNNGRDFRTVLEELLETEIPISKSAKWIKTKTGREQKLIWANAGMVRGDGRSLAWRILDAQYFGVPQRRRRIFLVADFGGQCAGEILFEPQGLPGNIAESREAWEETASLTGKSIEDTSRLNCWGNVVVHPQITGTLCASGAGMNRPAGMANETDLIVCQHIAFNGRQDPVSGAVTGALDTDRATQCIVYEALYAGQETRRTVGYVARRLLPIECERLQGLEDGYTAGGSDSARYKAIGNSMAKPCPKFIIRNITMLGKSISF